LLVHEPAGRSSEWTPERVSIDQQLARGDQVRLTSKGNHKDPTHKNWPKRD